MRIIYAFVAVGIAVYAWAFLRGPRGGDGDPDTSGDVSGWGTG